MRANDLQQVNGIISRAFTQGRIDDGYAFTDVPMCQARFMEMYYYQGEQGAFVVEESGQIRGAAFCHLWGKTGWIGPLAIVPEKHHLGLGKELALHATEYLKNQACATIGLETNPRSNRNLGFYTKIGFVPSTLSIDLIKAVSPIAAEHDAASVHTIIPYSLLSENQREKFLIQVANLTQMVNPTVDYSQLIKNYNQFEQGESLLFMRRQTPIAAAILQTEPSLVEEQNVLLRMVAFIAHPKTPAAYFPIFLEDIARFARNNKMDRILVRTPTHSPKTLRALLLRNYLVVNSDLRMTLDGYPENINANLFLMNRWV